MRIRTVVAAAAACLPGLVAAAVQLSPNPVDFGPQSMGTTSPALTVTITNTGPGSITVTTVSSNTAQFAPSHSCTTIAENASCPVQVTFTPTATAGDLESEAIVDGTLTVTTSAGSPTAALTGVAQKSLVTHFYRSILRRAPDAGGALHWKHEALRLQGLATNANEVWYAMSAFFLRSGEYIGFNRNDTDFLTDLYRTFFNREPDSGGMTFWQGQLGQGMPREIVVNAFMFSTEFRQFSEAIFGPGASRAEVDVVMDFYRGMLARLPDENGFAAWAHQLRQRQCNSQDIDALMRFDVRGIADAFSVEHNNRGRSNAQYVGDLYNAILRRGGDLQGVQSWIQQLDSSAKTRGQVRQDFLDSPEFAARIQALIGTGCINHGAVAAIGTGQSPAVMVGDDGVPVVAYITGNNVHLARCTDAACTTFATPSPISSTNNVQQQVIRISRGVSGFPVVFYAAGQAMNVVQCGNAACSSGNRTTRLFPNNGEQVSSPNTFDGLGAGADGAPIVSESRFHPNTTGATIRSVKCTTTDCAGTASTVLVDGLSPFNTNNHTPSIALGSDGLPITAYVGQNGSLRTAHCNDAACSTAGISVLDNFLTRGLALAMGATGLPAMAFGSVFNNRETVRYARCSAPDCSTGTSVALVLPYTGASSIGHAIPADGRPVITSTFAFFSATATYVIKVVKCGNASCSAGNVVTTLSLPSATNFLANSSIALRADGRPVIAFTGNNGLAYLLSCANAACTAVTP